MYDILFRLRCRRPGCRPHLCSRSKEPSPGFLKVGIPFRSSFRAGEKSCPVAQSQRSEDIPEDIKHENEQEQVLEHGQRLREQRQQLRPSTKRSMRGGQRKEDRNG